MKIRLITLVGILLIALSTICWLLIPVLPFIPLPLVWKAAAVPVLLILAEVFFWPGAILAGKEAVAKIFERFHPLKWLKKGGEGKSISKPPVKGGKPAVANEKKGQN